MKIPTHAQFSGIREAAINMDISRSAITSLVDDGSFTTLMRSRMDEILAGRENIRTYELTATVRQNRDYIEALEAGGPDTPSGYNVRKVGDLYLPVSEQEEEVEFVLRNFPKGGGSFDKALSWAKSNGYKITNPREAFAAVEQHDLLKLLDLNWLYLVATTECSFGEYPQAVVVISVDWSSRRARLHKLGDFGNDGAWFLFRK